MILVLTNIKIILLVVSSNINEGIRAVLFFKQKDFTRTKITKTHVSEQKRKRQRFYALKKHLRGRKLLIHLFPFLCFWCAFCAFCVFFVWNKRDSIFMHIKTSKKKKIACLMFYAFCAFYTFCAFYAHKKHLRGGKSLVCVLCFFVLFMLFVLFVHV